MIGKGKFSPSDVLEHTHRAETQPILQARLPLDANARRKRELTLGVCHQRPPAVSPSPCSTQGLSLAPWGHWGEHNRWTIDPRLKI